MPLPVFHNARAEPLPDAAPDSPLIDPSAEHCWPAGPVNALAGSTAICLHDPAAARLHAPRTERVPCVMGTPAWPKAVGAVVKVLLVDGFPQPRDRALDHLVLARGLADRAPAPVVRLEPDPRSRRRLVASPAQTLVQVAPVGVEGLGLPVGRHPIDARRTRLARVTVSLTQNVCVDALGAGRTHPLGLAGGLLRTALACWCDGW